MKIVAVDAALCRLPLPHPITIGAIRYPTRDYVAVRIRTDEGIDGYGLGYTRGTPLREAAAGFGEMLAGRDPLQRRALTSAIERAFPPGGPALLRAASLIDLALWDIGAKAAAMPLHLLLGGYRRTVPVMAVAGFFADARPAADIADEVGALAERGFRLIKVVIGGRTPRQALEFLQPLRAALPDGCGLAVDVHYAWADLEQAVRTCTALEQVSPEFVEDPFTPARARLTAELRARCRLPLAAGEDVSDPVQFLELTDATDYLRVDATASGGITAVLAACEYARLRGRPVIPHVFTPLHAQLAGALPSVRCVEMILPEAKADPLYDLLEETPRCVGGELAVDPSPGIGLRLDWGRVERLASQ